MPAGDSASTRKEARRPHRWLKTVGPAMSATESSKYPAHRRGRPRHCTGRMEPARRWRSRRPFSARLALQRRSWDWSASAAGASAASTTWPCASGRSIAGRPKSATGMRSCFSANWPELASAMAGAGEARCPALDDSEQLLLPMMARQRAVVARHVGDPPGRSQGWRASRIARDRQSPEQWPDSGPMAFPFPTPATRSIWS